MKILKIGDSLIFGVQHYNMGDVKKVSNYVKKNFKPNDNIVFMGEGGDDDNIYEKGGEQEAIKNELETYFTNFINDSWDGKETNVTNPKSSLFKEMQSETSLSSNKVMAAIYVIIVGQTNYPQEMLHLLNDEGIEWIKSFGIKNPKTPDKEDVELMYNLCFPQDTGKPETELSKLTDIFNHIRDKNLVNKIKNYRKKGYRVIATVGEGHIELIKNNFDNKEETKEQTDASSSGSFSGPLFGKASTIKRTISKIPNMNLNEVTTGDAGEYDVPLFGTSPKGRKNPLKIDGPDSIYKGRAVKDKKFPKWGGPDSVFVKVKEKCKKFPYCNQGDMNALEIIKEDDELLLTIKETAKKYGISYKHMESIVLNEINKIFI